MNNEPRWSYASTGILLGLTVLVGMFFLPRPGWSPELIRIGVVNWEQVILQYEGYQNELEELQSKRTKILRMIEEQYGNVDREALGKSGSVSGNQEMQQLYQETLKQHEQRRQKAIEEYHRKIKAAIREEAIEQGYSLILSENEVLYAAEGYTDLTNGVIERLNQNKSENQTS